MATWIKINVLFGFLLQISADQCLIDPNLKATNLATKTPYFYRKQSSSSKAEFPENCKEATRFWMISRHGTRYPSVSGIQSIRHGLPDLNRKSNLCQHDVELLKKWNEKQNFLTREHAKKLHPEGEKELIFMAERFQNIFSKVLSEDYHEDNYKFRSTNAQRAKESQFHFAIGLFGRQIAYQVQYEKPIQPFDPIIRFYKGCSKWQIEVKGNVSASLEEQHEFEESDVFTKKVKEPLDRLFNRTLHSQELDAMWISCTFGQAWQPEKLSPWCGVFTKEQRDILEYWENLEYFYQDSFGHPINSAQACVLMKDLLQSFTDESRPNATLYFSHSGALLKFLTYLNLGKPNVIPKHDNYGASTWTTSHLDIFANNIAFALLPCNKIGLFVNEQLTKIPDCSSSSEDDKWCDFDEFLRIFNAKLCDFDEICQIDMYKDYHFLDSEDDRV